MTHALSGVLPELALFQAPPPFHATRKGRNEIGRASLQLDAARTP